MSYNQFNIDKIKNDLGLAISEKFELFADITEAPYSGWLEETLATNLPLALAIATEKARSEMIVAPILIELKKQAGEISLFSGRDFNVDEEKGLNGFCDFLVSRSVSQLAIEAPVLAIVEAKNDNLQSGFGQCMAEMYAAQLFNERENNNIDTIYGSVTTGSLWQFMRLSGKAGKAIEIDLKEYPLNPGKILGIFLSWLEIDN
ncbi:MAG: hypothetical protein F6J93_06580 [Oscillatoria sp. SIO1A7]|nr:hypothetical protein [Oscillatoria sp. SIO1A7]